MYDQLLQAVAGTRIDDLHRAAHQRRLAHEAAPTHPRTHMVRALFMASLRSGTSKVAERIKPAAVAQPACCPA